MALNPISFDGYTAGITNKYPYTDFHEMNLDFLLSQYSSIINSLNETIAWANNHQIEYEEALARLIAVESEIESFETVVEAQFERLKADIEADFEQQKAELEALLLQTKAEVDAEVARMTEEVNAAIAAFDVRFNDLSAAIRSELVSLQIQVNDAIGRLERVIVENNEFIFDYVENRLDKFIEEFPDLIGIQVYNPIKGKRTPLQEAINDLYDASCIRGLTAIQFDELDLSVQEFNDYNLTAREFDQYSYDLLGFPDPLYYMYDPFTGEMNMVKNVVEKLAALHTDADSLSVSEFETLDLTAEEFDTEDITAFNFDWYSKTILAA